MARSLGTASALAAGIVLVGLAAVTALLNAERTRELAVRMALGAGPRSVAWMVLSEAVVVSATGTLIGLMGALASSRALEGRFWGLASFGAIDATAVVGVMTGIAVLSAGPAAWCVLHTDPARALRAE